MGGPPVGGERPFHRRLQHRRPVLLQLRPHPLQHLHPGVEVGQQLVEHVRDTLLLGFRRYRY